MLLLLLLLLLFIELLFKLTLFVFGNEFDVVNNKFLFKVIPVLKLMANSGNGNDHVEPHIVAGHVNDLPICSFFKFEFEFKLPVILLSLDDETSLEQLSSNFGVVL